MDIANKKRTYVWCFPRTFLGEDTTRYICFDVLYPYIIKSVYYFSGFLISQEINIYIYLFLAIKAGRFTMNILRFSTMKDIMPKEDGVFAINVTGHRPDKLGNHWSAFSDKHDHILKAFKYFLWKTIECKAQQGIRFFRLISGMALGIDSIFVRACKACKDYYEPRGIRIEIVAAIPCVKQYSKWQKNSKAEYRKLLAMCDSAKIVSWRYSLKCMQVRNIYMVKQADITIAYWNGTDGGTKNCVDYAIERKKPFFNIYDIAKEFEAKAKSK